MFLSFLTCKSPQGSSPQTNSPAPLPVLGYAPTHFTLLNQDSIPVTRGLFDGKVWVVDFFFTSCPTICPRMSAQMARLRDTFAREPNFLLLSHTIDPDHDSPSVLRSYVDHLGGDGQGKWHLVTGPRDTIYALADIYALRVARDAGAPGGIVHSGSLVLMDPQGRIRGYYDGTQEEDTDRLIKDIRRLLNESTLP
ncbi:MAG: SCO family protein [Flavobacteriales bacterium]|nr:SCO family protein [Flavobacteriales bacterium]MDW8410069.1 SCO family protein [Flavobacteriales bacterium]